MDEEEVANERDSIKMKINFNDCVDDLNEKIIGSS